MTHQSPTPSARPALPLRLPPRAIVPRDQEGPDGLRESTRDPEDVDDVRAMRPADGRAELARWLVGEHAPNDTDRRPATMGNP